MSYDKEFVEKFVPSSRELEFMLNKLNSFCDPTLDAVCKTCPIYEECKAVNSKFTKDDKDLVIKAYFKGFDDPMGMLLDDGLGIEPQPVTITYDNVERPKHYNREGAMESIDEMVLIFGKEAVMNFCKCNVWKYRYRAAEKNGEEDLKKSDWYMRKYKELSESNGETGQTGNQVIL